MRAFRIGCAATLLLALNACGVETAGTAATSAAIKKQEAQQGQNTMRSAQEKIDATAKQLEARSASDANSEK